MCLRSTLPAADAATTAATTAHALTKHKPKAGARVHQQLVDKHDEHLRVSQLEAVNTLVAYQLALTESMQLKAVRWN